MRLPTGRRGATAFDLYSKQNKSPLNSGCVAERGIQVHDKKLEEDGRGRLP